MQSPKKSETLSILFSQFRALLSFQVFRSVRPSSETVQAAAWDQSAISTVCVDIYTPTRPNHARNLTRVFLRNAVSPPCSPLTY